MQKNSDDPIGAYKSVIELEASNSTDKTMTITGFHDTRNDCRFVSAGIYALKAPALDVLAECLESGQTRMRYFQRKLLEAGMRLKAFDMGQVVDVDHVCDIKKAQKIAQQE